MRLDELRQNWEVVQIDFAKTPVPSSGMCFAVGFCHGFMGLTIDFSSASRAGQDAYKLGLVEGRKVKVGEIPVPDYITMPEVK